MTTESATDPSPHEGGASGGAAAARLVELIAAFLMTLLGVGAVIAVAVAILPPDPAAMRPELAARYALMARTLRPEPTERATVLIALAALAALALPMTRLARGAWVRRIPATAVVVALTLGAAAILLANYWLRYDLGMEDSLVPFAAAAGVATIILWKSRAATGRNAASVAWAAIVVALTLVFTFSWRTLDLRAMEPFHRYWGDMDAVLYSVVQSVGGKIPIADYPPQYGFYGALMAPWFRIVGLSVWSFTLSMNVLLLVATLAVLALAVREIRYVAFAVAAAFGVLYVTDVFAPLRWEPGPYFQYTPIRFLFPALAAFLVSIWLRRTTRALFVVISAAAGVALVWNLDSGVVVLGSWLLLLVFRWLERGRTGFRELPLALGIALVPPLLFASWLVWRSTGHVEMARVLEPIRVFYGAGITMLPMPRGFHPWQVVASVHVLGFVIGCVHLVRPFADARRATQIFFLSVLGLGLFVYYTGRSHDTVLLHVAWPAILVAAIVADWGWMLWRSSRLPLAVSVAPAAGVLTFGALCGLLSLADLPAILRLSRQHFSPDGGLGVRENVAMIRSHTQGRRDVVLLARFQAVYMAETGLVSAVRGPGVIETITFDQGSRMAGDIARLAPDQIFLDEHYGRVGPLNPYNALIPFLQQNYVLADSTTREELRRYVRIAAAPSGGVSTR